MNKILLAAALLTALTIGIAVADQHDHQHGIFEDDSYAGQRVIGENIYGPAMEKMHKNMMTTLTGNADIDFVRGMIPHHQGAVDMAKILKAKGKDPELQRLADEIIVAQEREIAFMQDWLAKNDR